MGSALYASVEYQASNGTWWPVTQYQTADLASGPVVDFFGDCDPDSPLGNKDGYLSHVEWTRMQDHEECPWRLAEPYWVRLIPGEEFVRTVREQPWKKEWPEKEAGPHLRAVAAMVESYMKDSIGVRVWCWHSQ